jgi:hypothetical protein
VKPGETCTTPTLTVPPPDPCLIKKCEPPTSEPTKPTRPTRPTKPSNPPTTTEPTSIPTPNRIDTGGGPAQDSPGWLLWMVPGLALLTLAGGLGGWWLTRTEQDRR